jgi:succinate dehydrogenase / fumarate reductase, membrane anchor subunit
MGKDVAMKFESELHRAQGLGPAKKGVSHWIAQRVTAISLVPLGIWFVGSFIGLSTASFDQAHLWLASPWSVSLAILFVFTMFYHGMLGMQVIWEDYVPHERTRWGLILFTKFLSILFAFLATLSILKIYVS